MFSQLGTRLLLAWARAERRLGRREKSWTTWNKLQAHTSSVLSLASENTFNHVSYPGCNDIIILPNKVNIFETPCI